MNDFYSEHLVKKKREAKETVIKAVMIVLTVLGFLFNIFIPFGIVLACLLVVADVVTFRRLDIEYEYMYLNGELDIDMILHKERRKKLCSIRLEDIEIIAPTGAVELDNYKNIQVTDYSSRYEGAETYDVVCSVSGEKRRVRFEPKEAVLQDMWMRAPRKVIRKVR